jgi:hypothetical protein
LARFDAGWRLAEQASRGAFALTRLARDLGPLALPALLAYRRPVTTFTAAAVRVWPPAALAVFLATQHGVGSGGMHAFVGVTVPLAILAVDGVGRLGRVPRALRLILVAVAVGALTVPVMVDRIRATRPFLLPSGAGANLVTSTNRQVLHYLKRSPQAGGVLAIWTFGPLVPAETGRRVYVGDIFWSRPDLRGRVARSDALVNQTMSAPQARAFVLSTGARFVVDPYCRHAKLTAQLAPITAGVARFGCTAVYTIKRPAG